MIINDVDEKAFGKNIFNLRSGESNPENRPMVSPKEKTAPNSFSLARDL